MAGRGVETLSEAISATDNRLGGRLSMGVTLTCAANNPSWIDTPGIAYTEAYVMFPSDPGVPLDVFTAIDCEWMDGVNNPYHISGGDWMCFAAFLISGYVIIAAGTAETEAGIPSTERNWREFALSAPLVPDQWYRVRITGNFLTRMYVSLQVEGPGVNDDIDLSALRLDYPNYLPFDERALTFFVGAIKFKDLIAQPPPKAETLWWDDVIGVTGVTQLITSSFETQSTIGDQPLPPGGPPILTGNYALNVFYKEAETAKVTVETVSFARTGSNVLQANVSLSPP